MMNATTSEQVFENFVQAARRACWEIQRLDMRSTRALLTSLIQVLHEANYLTDCSIEAPDDDLEGASSLPDALTRIPDELVFPCCF